MEGIAVAQLIVFAVGFISGGIVVFFILKNSIAKSASADQETKLQLLQHELEDERETISELRNEINEGEEKHKKLSEDYQKERDARVAAEIKVNRIPVLENEIVEHEANIKKLLDQIRGRNQ